MKNIIFLLTMAGFFSLLMFCGEETLAPYEKEYFFPKDSISYYLHVQPLVAAKCGIGSNCHAADNPTNFLFFSSRDVFINHEIGQTGHKLVTPEIDRYKPTFAPLYLIITDNSYSIYERMPPLSYGREPLTEGEIEGIRQWISEGAPN